MTDFQDPSAIAGRVSQIRRRVDALAGGAGPVTLVAATKTVPAEIVREAVLAGVDAVGENRVQELLEKDAQGAYRGAPLHFIGHLQRNKVSKLVGRVDLIQSVDSVALAEAVDACAKQRDLVQDILLQVNIAREPTKGGFDPGGLLDTVKCLASLRQIRIRGLMSIPPPIHLNGDTQYFVAMRQLYVDIREKNMDNIRMDFLSMGMSDDYEPAVRAGANMLRIGSALFGPRLGREIPPL